jgi:hypothetical protein
MIKKLFAACILTGLAGNIAAQKPEDHKKTSYTDSVGRFIVQVDMPIYLYVATSPDETPLRLERSDIKENKPIYLDGPGKHHIRHMDNINHRAEVFDIYADGQAPKTTVTLNGATTFVSSGVTYFGKDLTVKLSATDDMSGLKQIYYSTGNGNFAPYQNIDANNEGNYQLSFYSVDNVGNVETVKRRDFVVDLSPPVSNHNIVGIVKDNIISKNAQISITANDNASGIARIMYRFDNEPEKQYKQGANISFAHLKDGMHTLYYYSEDNVRNRENEKSIDFFFDKTPPILSADVLGDRFIVGDKVYFSGRSKLKLTAVDNKSGVKEIRYSINNGPFLEYEDPFYLPSVAGRHVVRYYAVDEMGNSSSGDYTYNSGIVYVDLAGPVLSHELSGPSFQKGDVMFVSPETKIILKGVDAESGLQYLSYSVDNRVDETRYETPFSVKESGAHTVRYFGYDNVNNRNSRDFEITVDGDGPEIFATFSIKRIDDATDTANPQFAGVYPSYIMLYLAATDLLTGNAEIYYSVNDEKEIPYTAPIRGFVKNTSYTVFIRAKDKLGNFSEKTVTFKTGDY